MDSIKGARFHAVAQPKAAERTAGIAPVKSRGDGTIGDAIVLIKTRTVVAGSFTADHRDLFSRYRGGLSQDGGHSIHCLLPAYGAVEAVKCLRFHASHRERSASRKTTPATISGRQCFLYLFHTRIFLYFKSLSHEEQDRCASCTNGTQRGYSS